MTTSLQFEQSSGIPHTKEGIRTVSSVVMHALCGDAYGVVPDEYTHCKPTAVEFVIDHFQSRGVLNETIMAGVQTAYSRYAKS